MVGMECVMPFKEMQELIPVINLRPDCKVMGSYSNRLHPPSCEKLPSGNIPLCISFQTFPLFLFPSVFYLALN